MCVVGGNQRGRGKGEGERGKGKGKRGWLTGNRGAQREGSGVSARIDMEVEYTSERAYECTLWYSGFRTQYPWSVGPYGGRKTRDGEKGQEPQ